MSRYLAPQSFRSEREWRNLLRLAKKLRREPTRAEDRALTRASRIARARFVMNLTEAATVLCVDPRIVSKAIRDGRLPAEREDLEGERFRFRILRSDLQRFAAEEAEVTAADDDRVATIRLAEFEERGGES